MHNLSFQWPLPLVNCVLQTQFESLTEATRTLTSDDQRTLLKDAVFTPLFFRNPWPDQNKPLITFMPFGFINHYPIETCAAFQGRAGRTLLQVHLKHHSYRHNHQIHHRLLVLVVKGH